MPVPTLGPPRRTRVREQRASTAPFGNLRLPRSLSHSTACRLILFLISSLLLAAPCWRRGGLLCPLVTPPPPPLPPGPPTPCHHHLWIPPPAPPPTRRVPEAATRPRPTSAFSKIARVVAVGSAWRVETTRRAARRSVPRVAPPAAARPVLNAYRPPPAAQRAPPRRTPLSAAASYSEACKGGLWRREEVEWGNGGLW